MGVVGGQRLHSLGEFFATQKPLVCLKEAPKQTWCSLLTLDMLDILCYWGTSGNGDRHLNTLLSKPKLAKKGYYAVALQLLH